MKNCTNWVELKKQGSDHYKTCLLYTSDAADDLHCVDLVGRRLIKKQNTMQLN